MDHDDDNEPIYAGGRAEPGRDERDGEPTATPAVTGDDYFERLVKYIPAEALTFFLLVSSSSGIADGLLVAVVVIGVLGAVLWASNRNQRLRADLRQSTWRLAGFTIPAFLAWALGTSGAVQDLVGLSQQTAMLVTFTVSFLLPGVDEALALRTERSTGLTA